MKLEDLLNITNNFANIVITDNIGQIIFVGKKHEIWISDEKILERLLNAKVYDITSLGSIRIRVYERRETIFYKEK